MTASEQVDHKQDPLRVAVLGAGGVGGWYAGALALAGHDVSVLARGDHLETMRRDGLELRSQEGSRTARPRAAERVEELGNPELVIVAVKAYSVREIASSAARLAEGGAAILPLLNGVDAADRLAELGVPREALIGGLTMISAAKIAPGVIERRSTFQRVIMGALGGAFGSTEVWTARLERYAEALRSAGVETVVSQRIEGDLWNKLVFLATLAAACGLSRSAVGAVRTAPLGALLLERAVREIVAVAESRGVPLGADATDRTLAAIAALPAAMRPSLLLDLEHGGPTEIDVLSGAVARMGRECGIATPVHDTALAAIGAATA
ncbi:MAG: 2-dehydropantoate 2-reductase [Gemmatimonadota bacterium]